MSTDQEVPQGGDVEPVGLTPEAEARLRLVRRAVSEWKGELIDLVVRR